MITLLFPYSHPRFHIGDEGIQCQKTALSPVKRRGDRVLSPAEKKFNKTLSSLRIIVEQTFGDWKNKFPIVSTEVGIVRKDKSHYSQATILSTVILYNIYKSFEGPAPMPSQEALDNLAKFDQLMSLGPEEQILAEDDNTFMRSRVIEKWFTAQ